MLIRLIWIENLSEDKSQYGFELYVPTLESHPCKSFWIGNGLDIQVWARLV